MDGGEVNLHPTQLGLRLATSLPTASQSQAKKLNAFQATVNEKLKYLEEALAEETKRREAVEQQAAENAKRRKELEAAIEENQRSQEWFQQLLEESEEPARHSNRAVALSS